MPQQVHTLEKLWCQADLPEPLAIGLCHYSASEVTRCTGSLSKWTRFPPLVGRVYVL